METLGREVYSRALRPLLEELELFEATKPKAQVLIRRFLQMLCTWYDTKPRALALLIFPPHDFCPEELGEGNPRTPRRVLQRLLRCDADTIAVVWGAMTGPLQDRYLRRRSGKMAPMAPELAKIVSRLVASIRP